MCISATSGTQAEREAVERAADEGIELKSQHVSRFFKIRKSRPHE